MLFDRKIFVRTRNKNLASPEIKFPGLVSEEKKRIFLTF